MSGPNALRSHGPGAIAVLVGQLRNPFLLLLLATAVASAFFGERTDAIIIFLIGGLSVGLGFVSEYRSSARSRRSTRSSGTRSSRCATGPPQWST